MKKDTIKLLETKHVVVGTEKLPVRLTFRAIIDFEKITGKSLQGSTSTEDAIILFYCAAKAGAKADALPFAYDFEGFLDLVDNYPDSLMDFYIAIAEGEPEVKKQKTKVA